MPINVAKAMLIEVNVTAFWLPPVEWIYRVANERMHRLTINDSFEIVKCQVL